MGRKFDWLATGQKSAPSIVLLLRDSRSPRDGRFLERLGSYDPTREPALIEIKQDRLAEWLKNGARPTETVAQPHQKGRTRSRILI